MDQAKKHVCSPMWSIFFLKQVLALFWTAINVLLQNYSQILKVITFGAFKINFPFLHSIWLMQGDKVCSQSFSRQREVALVRTGYCSFLRFTGSTEKPVPNHCVEVCVSLSVTKNTVMNVFMRVSTNPRVNHVESDFLNTLSLDRTKGIQWNSKSVFNSLP